MARERWFFAQGNQRRGPVPLAQLVEALLGAARPAHGARVAQGLRRLDARRGRAGGRAPARALPREEGGRGGRARRPSPRPSSRPRRRARVEEAKPGSPALVYGGIAAGVAVLGLLGLALLAAAGAAAPPVPVPLGGTTTENAPAVVIPRARRRRRPRPVATPPPRRRPATRGPRPAPDPGAAGVADRESDLPRPTLRKLRGVAAWAGDTLKRTVYNGTGWRVTELYVRVGRFVNEDFVEDRRPLLLVPPGGQVDAGVADLLSRVAPDRKKPGLNPLDTGVFEGRRGARPRTSAGRSSPRAATRPTLDRYA